MVKKRGLVIIMSIVLVLSVLNVFLFVNTGDISYNAFTGRFVKEIPDLPWNINLSLIAFAIQWVILLILAILAYVRHSRKTGDEHLKISYSQISKRKGKFETDFDIFYELIQKRKKMRISSIAKTFEISEDQALEWSKILEGSGLVTIEYPAFYEPEVRLVEKITDKTKNKKGVKNEKEVDKEGKEERKGKTKKQEKGREKEKQGKKSEGKGREKNIKKEQYHKQKKLHKEKPQRKEVTKQKKLSKQKAKAKK